MHIRLAGPADNEAIRAIYNAEVDGGRNTFDLVARKPADQTAWLDRHRGAHPAVVALTAPGDGAGVGRPGAGDGGPEPAGTVLGFGSISPYRSRPAYATTVESSVYVDGTHRGRGVGKAILTELVRLAAGHGFHSMIARIVAGNDVSIGLHRSCGFTLVGMEREVGRKQGRWLDVVELQRML